MGFGSDKAGGFNVESRTYKRNPSIELYVKLRRESPDAEIEVAVVGGLDQLMYMETELDRYGFDPIMVAGALDADPEAISELSLQIMEKMIQANSLTADGHTHLIGRNLAVPDKLINWLITMMLDALSWNDDLRIPRDLIVLIRERLGGSDTEYERSFQSNTQRRRAVDIAAGIMAKGGTVTVRLVARAMGVAPSTVLRWFPEGDFLDQVKHRSKWYDAGGRLRPLDEIFRKGIDK